MCLLLRLASPSHVQPVGQAADRCSPGRPAPQAPGSAFPLTAWLWRVVCCRHPCAGLCVARRTSHSGSALLSLAYGSVGSRSKTCWPSGRPTLTRRPWSPGSPTDRSAGQVGRRVRAAALHAGTELTDLQNTGRWQSTSMPVRCSRGQRASRGAVARYYGVDG